MFNNDSPDKNESNSIAANVSLWKVVELFKFGDAENENAFEQITCRRISSVFSILRFGAFLLWVKWQSSAGNRQNYLALSIMLINSSTEGG